ncbi:MAG TPA: SulP family inorganic anion transporter [Thermomicrobiales bacterium]|nr:SulP family inorganic anion transporter [Thermomicrobiales bacterium]
MLATIWTVIVARFSGFRIGRPNPTKGDVLSALTNGVAGIPDGMTSGVIAGINPVYGLYTLMVSTPVAALTMSTRLMVVNTTSAMILVAADGLGDLEGDERVQAMIAITLIAGIFQLALGVLGLGMLTKFVSNAVMTGLLTGVSVLIILGQLWDFFGYSGEGDTKLAKTADLITHFGNIDFATTLIGLLAIGLMVGLGYTRVAQFNLLIALALATAIAWLWDRNSIALVSSLGDIPSGLPEFHVPEFRQVVKMGVTGVAVGIVGLLQAAGVAQRYPNTNGREPDDSQDFMAQGFANIAGSFFQAMPGGGSLSGTALGVSSGAQTRWASFMMAIVVIVFVLLLGGVLELIPMAALAALLIYSSSLSIKFPLIQSVQRTNWRSQSAMLLTFVLALVVPLQQAIVLGVVAASVLFIYRASTDIRVTRLQRKDGHLVESPVPSRLESDQTYLLDIDGSLFYAGARTLQHTLPTVGNAQRSAVVLRLKGQGDVGSTLLGILNTYAVQLREHHGILLLAGIEPAVHERMRKLRQVDGIGIEHVYASTRVRHESIREAEAFIETWRSGTASSH